MNISIFINKIRWISYSVAANLDNQSLFFPKSLVLLYALAIVDTMQKQKELLCQRDSQSFLYFTKLPFSEIVFVSFLNKNNPFILCVDCSLFSFVFAYLQIKRCVFSLSFPCFAEKISFPAKNKANAMPISTKSLPETFNVSLRICCKFCNCVLLCMVSKPVHF